MRWWQRYFLKLFTCRPSAEADSNALSPPCSLPPSCLWHLSHLYRLVPQNTFQMCISLILKNIYRRSHVFYIGINTLTKHFLYFPKILLYLSKIYKLNISGLFKLKWGPWNYWIHSLFLKIKWTENVNMVCVKKGLLLALLPMVYKMQLYCSFVNRIYFLKKYCSKISIHITLYDRLQCNTLVK